MRSDSKHVPVALDRCISLLAPSIEQAIEHRGLATVVDATLGMGGHSRALLEKFPKLRIIGFDRDTKALEEAKKNLCPYAERLTAVHAVYDEIEEVFDGLGIETVDGFLFDLGVSSMQLDEGHRGFAYSYPAPLDMRMDQTAGMTAQDVLMNYSKDELIRILRQYGEERFAPRIADRLIDARQNGGLKDTQALAELVKSAIPAAARRIGGNPAKRTFQALRIEVNQELDVLDRAIPAALAHTSVGGRIVVMAYQSLEDKIVKGYFTDVCTSKTPRNLPVELPESAAKFSFVINGSEKATEAEIAENPRAQSVRIRAIERRAA